MLLVLVGALVLSTLGQGATLARPDDGLRHREHRVERRIDRAHEELEGSSARARAAAARLNRARSRLTVARADLRAARRRLVAARALDRRMQQRLEAAQARLDRARIRLHAARLAVDRQQAAVADMVSAIYQEGDPDLLTISSLLDSVSAADLTRRLEARIVVVGEATRTYDDLRAAETGMRRNEARVRQAAREVAARRLAAAAHLRTVTALQVRALTAARAVRSWVQQSRQARVAASRARQADRAQLRNLRHEARRIRELLRRRAAAARAAAGGGSGGGAGSRGGYLDQPVDGYVTSPFGYRRHPIYGYWGLHDGVDFGGGCRLAIRAPASGRVISEYYQTAYGNRLILDHGYVRGVGLATIYNHASSYVVGPGQRVSRGQLLGYTGNTGWSTACHLHFTVMANGTPVDPMGWF